MRGGKSMAFDYFYGRGTEQFAFYQIPKVLITDDRFAEISLEAKFLYSLMLDRAALSAKNGWLDAEGRVYIYYTLEQVMADLRCANQKATKLMKELEVKIGLIERRKQGQGKPARIYVKDFMSGLHGCGNDRDLPEAHENHESGVMRITGQDSRKSCTNNTDNNKTDISETNLIHPFKVVEDDDMRKTVESIRTYGVMSPVIVRPDSEGTCEMISGHRRRYASILAGKSEVPAIVREMDDDTATILMVDCNLQREHILPSEKAKAYKMKIDAIRHQGKRTDLTSCRAGTKYRADEEIARQTGESARTVQRFIRLNHLIPELLTLVDERKMAFNPAVEISYMKPEEQQIVYEAMNLAQTTPSISQALRLKKSSQDGTCTEELMKSIMDEEKKNPLNRIVFDRMVLQKYFPQNISAREMEVQILQLLEDWRGKKNGMPEEA